MCHKQQLVELFKRSRLFLQNHFVLGFLMEVNWWIKLNFLQNPQQGDMVFQWHRLPGQKKRPGKSTAQTSIRNDDYKVIHLLPGIRTWSCGTKFILCWLWDLKAQVTLVHEEKNCIHVRLLTAAAVRTSNEINNRK